MFTFISKMILKLSTWKKRLLHFSASKNTCWFKANQILQLLARLTFKHFWKLIWKSDQGSNASRHNRYKQPNIIA